MEKSALILMTTYNGEKFISQQLSSIISQTWKNWCLIIRDDGSSDATISILNDFKQKDNRIIVIENETEKHGSYMNFWTLIHEVRENYSEYDYYFFSDQDDIWESDKLKVMINAAEKENTRYPLLLYADMRVINQYNDVIYESLNSVMGIGEMSGYSLFFTHGFLWGCDVCVNSELFNSMPLLPLNHPYIDIMSHDNYMGKYALLTGRIKYIKKILVNHRRHENNTTGGYSMRLNLISIFNKSILQLDDLARTHARVYNQTLIMIEMVRQQKNSLPQVAAKIQEAIESGGIKMVKAMRGLGVKRRQSARTIGIYAIALFRGYKKYSIK